MADHASVSPVISLWMREWPSNCVAMGMSLNSSHSCHSFNCNVWTCLQRELVQKWNGRREYFSKCCLISGPEMCFTAVSHSWSKHPKGNYPQETVKQKYQQEIGSSWIKAWEHICLNRPPGTVTRRIPLDMQSNRSLYHPYLILAQLLWFILEHKVRKGKLGQMSQSDRTSHSPCP